MKGRPKDIQFPNLLGQSFVGLAGNNPQGNSFTLNVSPHTLSHNAGKSRANSVHAQSIVGVVHRLIDKKQPLAVASHSITVITYYSA